MMKRRTEITIETERLLIVHRRQTSARAWCPSCDKQVQMITADEAAQSSRSSSRLIYRLVESGELHFIETTDNQVLICTHSLNQMLEVRQRISRTDAC